MFVRTFSLRTRKVVREQHVSGAMEAAEGTFITNATDLELRSNGSLAWIWRVSRSALGAGPSYEHQVWKSDADGAARLAASASVEPDSLAASGSQIYWTEDDQPRSAGFR